MRYLFATVGIALQALGLAGLADSVVAWRDFAGDIMAHYANMRDLIFGLLPFSIPNLVKDYLVVGLSVAAAWGRYSNFYFGLKDDPIHERMFSFLIYVLLWPLFMVLLLFGILLSLAPGARRKLSAADFEELRRETRGVVKELALVAAGVVVMVFLFSDFQDKLW